MQTTLTRARAREIAARFVRAAMFRRDRGLGAAIEFGRDMVAHPERFVEDGEWVIQKNTHGGSDADVA